MSNITIGSTVYAVYGTVAGAKAYFQAASHGAAWLALSSSDQRNALITSSRMLERTGWSGDPTDPIDKSNFTAQPPNTQPLQWPRTGLVDRNGDALDSTAIPLDVIDAAYEIALDASASTSTIQIQTSAREAKRMREKVDVIETEVEYFANTAQKSKRFPLIVEELIGLWMSANAATTLSVLSGGTVTSGFTDCDTDFGFNGTSGLP